MTDIDPALQSQVDRQLLEQGAFTPLELLLTIGRLNYGDYERWRLGELESLDQALLGNPDRIRRQLDSAVDYAGRIGLVEERRDFTSWREGQGELRISADPGLARQLAARFAPRRDSPQMDIFFDNPVVVLVNGIAAALARGALAAAESHLEQLYREAPNHSDLALYDQLVAALRRSGGPVADAAAELAALQQITPHTKRLLGTGYRDFLVPLWRHLSTAFEGRPFSPEQPDCHASYVLTQAENWRGVSAAVRREEQWWREATLCLRLAQSAHRLGERSESLAAWAYLCWYYPEQAAETLDSASWPDLEITGLWQRFCEVDTDLDLDEPLPAEDFPTWLLLAQPGLARVLSPKLPREQSAAEVTFRLCHQLVDARQSGDAQRELEQRAQVQQRQPALFAYLKSRL